MKYYSVDAEARCVACGEIFPVEDTRTTENVSICPYCGQPNGLSDTYLDGFEVPSSEDGDKEVYIDGYLSEDLSEKEMYSGFGGVVASSDNKRNTVLKKSDLERAQEFFIKTRELDKDIGEFQSSGYRAKYKKKRRDLSRDNYY